VAFYAVRACVGWIATAGGPAAAAPTDPAMLQAIGLIVVELLLVTAIALFFSTFSSPFLSAILTLGLWVVGHFNADLRHFETVVQSRAAAMIARALYYVLPNFDAFDIKTQIVQGLPVTGTYVAL